VACSPASGARAYSEDFVKANPHSRLGDRMLIEGLWYYDDQYVGDPGYDKVIDKIVAGGRKTR
jgi:hypothetical protein